MNAASPHPRGGLLRALPRLLALILFLVLAGVAPAHAQTNSGALSLNIGINGLNQPVDVDSAMKVLAIMTLLTLAPSINI